MMVRRTKQNLITGVVDVIEKYVSLLYSLSYHAHVQIEMV